MTENTLAIVEEYDEIELDEVGQILAVLRQLEAKAPSPVIRVCLEEARSAIAHLAAVGDEYQDAANAEFEGHQEAA